MTEIFTTKEILDYVWNYYQLHSKQRISVFNFYVSFSSLITIPLVLTVEKEKNVHLLGIILGFLLFILSVVFYRLDQRVRMLIKISEDALKELENNIAAKNNEKLCKMRIFHCVETYSKNKWGEVSFPNKCLFSYTKCFNLVFLIFGIIGIIFILYHFYQIIIIQV